MYIYVVFLSLNFDAFVKMISSKDFSRRGSKLTSMVFRLWSSRLHFDVFPRTFFDGFSAGAAETSECT